MPDTPKQPVTLADLRVEDRSLDWKDAEGWIRSIGHRPATVADLVSALRAEGVLVIEKENRKWPKWALDVVYYEANDLGGEELRILDGLAEAQPFPPAGGVS